MTGWNLPPGCNVSDIPGNRLEDVAEERVWEAMTHEDVRNQHLDYVTNCPHARRDECGACGITGHERPAPDDAGNADTLPCPACGGSGFGFGKCEHDIIDIFGTVNDGATWSDCPYVADLACKRIDEALGR